MRVSTCTAGCLWIVAAGQFAGAGEAVSGPECAPALCVPGRAPCGSVTGRAEEGSVSEEFRCLLRSELSQSGDWCHFWSWGRPRDTGRAERSRAGAVGP